MTLPDSLALAGGICGAVAIVGFVALLIVELRRSGQSVDDEQPTTYSLSAAFGPYAVEVTSEHPITVEDLLACRIQLVRVHGLFPGIALTAMLAEELIAQASATIDDDLLALAGGESG